MEKQSRAAWRTGIHLELLQPWDLSHGGLCDGLYISYIGLSIDTPTQKKSDQKHLFEFTLRFPLGWW
jgi:hypothetical protein